jgi:hypothetical protein
MPILRSRPKASSARMTDTFRKITRVTREVRAAGLFFRRKGGRKPLVYAHHLTERSCQVLKLLGDGLAIDEIAQRLGNSPGTVKNYCQDLRLAFGGGVPLETIRQTAWLWQIGELRIVTPIRAREVKLPILQQLPRERRMPGLRPR